MEAEDTVSFSLLSRFNRQSVTRQIKNYPIRSHQIKNYLIRN